jgi:(1->4)-alpha-D-glucan 1-alpha-D-glucosylmutase
VTAKGVEDTALYRFTRLSSLNEVGGEPESFGWSPRQFHTDARYRVRQWPHEMLATSTHDTKRSEDVRARINVLSEMVSVWRKSLQRWRHMNRARRKTVDELPAPGPHAEYLLYQTLLGTWPLTPIDDAAFAAYRERIEEYMVKASREAKRRTSWANVNAEYEEALRQFIRLALERREGNLFATEVAELARLMARFGFLNGLSQTLIKLTAPGVPDIYQGNEIWDDSLVDPDNRRPVDYEHRRRLLADVKSWTEVSLAKRLSDALESIEDGRCKLYVTARALEFRTSHEPLFRSGDYVPLRVQGEYAAHIVAYARTLNEQLAIVVVPRLCARLLAGRSVVDADEIWSDTRIELPRHLANAALRNLLDGATLRPEGAAERPTVRAAALFATFPVALLTT